MSQHRRLYILSHQTGYRAFEDYYDNLRLSINHILDVRIIIYNEESEIPLPREQNEIYLFFSNITPHFINLFMTEKHKHIYLINTEQSTRPLWSLIINHYAKLGITIFDYDQYQTELTQKMLPDKSIFYLPYQITKNESNYLTTLVRKTKKRYHVAFCSTNKSKKRLNLYTQLEGLGLDLIDVNAWREDRDTEIAKAQILVNIHYDKEYQIFEHMRCDRWILAGMIVVSEESLSDSLLDCKDLIITEKYENLVEKIMYLVDHYEEYYAEYLCRLIHQKKNIIANRRKFCDQLIHTLNK